MTQDQILAIKAVADLFADSEVVVRISNPSMQVTLSKENGQYSAAALVGHNLTMKAFSFDDTFSKAVPILNMLK